MIPKPTPRLKEPHPLKSRPHLLPVLLRADVLNRDEFTCAWCEVPGGRLDVHHIQRRSQGGKDELVNLISVHRLCHMRIHEHPSEAKARGFLA